MGHEKLIDMDAIAPESAESLKDRLKPAV